MSRMLIVEDDRLNSKLAAIILRRAGHTASVAGDTNEAERLIREEKPDLILMDVGLPDRDGYAFTRRLRERDDTRDIPILAVTSFATSADRALALDAGCTDYASKPVDRVLLLAQIQRLLDASEASKKLQQEERSHTWS
jgi:DNA-binding response OmpR family regulator